MFALQDVQWLVFKKCFIYQRTYQTHTNVLETSDNQLIERGAQAAIEE